MSTLLKLGVILALAAGIILWFYQSSDAPTSGDEPPVAAAPPVSTPPAVEKYPVPAVVQERPSELVPLPDLRDSDAYFKLELANLFGSGFTDILRESGGIERFVATIDNLPRARLAERLRPLDGPAGTFQATALADNTFEIAPENAERYADYIGFVTRASDDDLVDVYRRFYPLLQEAYVNLGYPDGFFNDRVIEVIDNLLATPDLAEPPRLIRPHVLYEFEDEELEALSVGQKALLRIGADNAALVKQRLRQLRSRLTELQ